MGAVVTILALACPVSLHQQRLALLSGLINTSLSTTNQMQREGRREDVGETMHCAIINSPTRERRLSEAGPAVWSTWEKRTVQP